MAIKFLEFKFGKFLQAFFDKSFLKLRKIFRKTEKKSRKIEKYKIKFSVTERRKKTIFVPSKRTEGLNKMNRNRWNGAPFCPWP